MLGNNSKCLEEVKKKKSGTIPSDTRPDESDKGGRKGNQRRESSSEQVHSVPMAAAEHAAGPRVQR